MISFKLIEPSYILIDIDCGEVVKIGYFINCQLSLFSNWQPSIWFIFNSLSSLIIYLQTASVKKPNCTYDVSYKRVSDHRNVCIHSLHVCEIAIWKYQYLCKEPFVKKKKKTLTVPTITGEVVYLLVLLHVFREIRGGSGENAILLWSWELASWALGLPSPNVSIQFSPTAGRSAIIPANANLIL